MLKSLLLSLFLLTASCVTLPNNKLCSVSGVLADGAICATSISHETSELTLDEFILFLEPTEARGGAICQSAEDWGRLKTALEKACRLLGNRCTPELHEFLNGGGSL